MAAHAVSDFRFDSFYSEIGKYLASGKIQEEEEYLLDCEEILLKEQKMAFLIAVYNELGALYRATGRFTSSLDAYEKARLLIESLRGHSSAEYAALTNNMAGTCRLAGEPERAIEMFEESLGIYEACGEGDTDAAARIHNNIAPVLMETGHPQESIQHFLMALNRFRLRPECAQESAMICVNLTGLYRENGDMENALKYLEEALSVFETLSQKKDESRAAAMSSLAGFLYSAGEYERSLEVYRSAADYTERFFGWNEEYASLCQSMYWVYRKTGKMQSAVIALTKAEKVYAELLGPGSEKTSAVRDELKRITA